MQYDDIIYEMKQYVLDTFRKGGQGQTLSGRQASTHPWTGAFEKSLEEEIIVEENKTIINILGNEYGEYLNRGVSSSSVKGMLNIRKRGEGGDGKKSKYINGLHNWVKGKLGISDEKKSLSVAFAIAKSHRENGFPTRDNKLGSWWIDGDEADQEILDKLADIYYGAIEKEINKIWQSSL